MIYTPQAALNHIYHNNDYYYVQPKPKPSFEERVEDWNKYLRSKVARDVVMSAVSDCKDKEKSFSRVVFIITSMLYIVGSAAVYAACAKLSFYDSFHEAVLFFNLFGLSRSSFDNYGDYQRNKDEYYGSEAQKTC